MVSILRFILASHLRDLGRAQGLGGRPRCCRWGIDCHTADYLNMVKIASCEDAGYRKVSEHPQLLVEEAPNVIDGRWEEHNRVKKGTGPILM